MIPLRRYLAIVDRQASARYLTAQSVPVSRLDGRSTEDLWAEHYRRLEEYRSLITAGTPPEPTAPSLMDLKRELAQRRFADCRLCEHDCQVDRRKERGFCRVGVPHVASQFVHMGEEAPLVPSYTVFFSGCNLQCVFCQNHEISTDPELGRVVTAQEMSERIEREARRGARNINWVGGDPTPALPYVLEVLSGSGTDIAQVWNSNMYLSREAMSLLDGVVDLYLTDLKYGNDDCAGRLSGVKEYMRVVTRNHLLARSQCEVLVRHLMLPGHLECCTLPVLNWLTEHMPGGLVNIMAQYRPEHLAKDFLELKERVPWSDHRQAIEYARRKGLHLI